MSNSFLQTTSLVGTTWLIKETKGGFCPFTITFNAGGQAVAKTTNGNFYGNFTWSGNFTDVEFEGSFNTQDKGVLTCIGSPELGNGHYTYKWSGAPQIGKFTMAQQ